MRIHDILSVAALACALAAQQPELLADINAAETQGRVELGLAKLGSSGR